MRPRVLVAPIMLLLAAPVSAEDRPLPDVQTFVAQVKAHLATDEERQNGYMYLEKRIAQKVDAAGRLKDESVDVFEVYPGLPGEDGPYRRQIQDHGRPVAPDTLARRDRERQKKAEAYVRSASSAAAQQKASAAREKSQREIRDTVDDLLRVYDVRLVKRDAFEGHQTIMATLTPRPGSKPRTDGGRFLRHFKARAWISETEFEPVRVEMEAIDDLSIGWSLLARIHKGTEASFQRRKVNGEVWLPEQATWTASARVLLLKRLRLRGVAEFSGYRKFTVDTATTPASLAP